MKDKPSKPYPEFPLTPHPRGKWCKKIKGRMYYFGSWEDPDAALEEYRQFVASVCEKPAARPSVSLTLYDACQLFLDSKDQQRSTGETSSRTYQDYVRTLKRLCSHLGKERSVTSLTPQDFSSYKSWMGTKWNVVSVGNEITRVKAMLNWLRDEKLAPPVETGRDFRKPSRKATRKYRRSRGKKILTPDQILGILDESGIHLQAMILLGINGGFQNVDCEEIPASVCLDAIETGWMEFPRIKTEVERRFPLWKSTRSALARSMKRRPATDLPNAFVMPNGRAFSGVNCDIAKRFRAARDHALIKEGGFSWLRKTFATVASACGDQVAVDYVMGHVDPSIGEVYRQDMQDQRLRKVANTVGRWLYLRNK